MVGGCSFIAYGITSAGKSELDTKKGNMKLSFLVCLHFLRRIHSRDTSLRSNKHKLIIPHYYIICQELCQNVYGYRLREWGCFCKIKVWKARRRLRSGCMRW